MAAFELLDGDAWMIYHNAKAGVFHWDSVSRLNTMTLSPNLRSPEER